MSEWNKYPDTRPLAGQHVYIAILQKYTNAPQQYSICDAVYSGYFRDVHSDNTYHTPTHWMAMPPRPTAPELP